MQVPQIVSFLEAKTKTIFYIGYDDLALSVAIILFVHAFASVMRTNNY
jgi:hypothetical protein